MIIRKIDRLIITKLMLFILLTSYFQNGFSNVAKNYSSENHEIIKLEITDKPNSEHDLAKLIFTNPGEKVVLIKNRLGKDLILGKLYVSNNTTDEPLIAKSLFTKNYHENSIIKPNESYSFTIVATENASPTSNRKSNRLLLNYKTSETECESLASCPIKIVENQKLLLLEINYNNNILFEYSASPITKLTLTNNNAVDQLNIIDITDTNGKSINTNFCTKTLEPKENCEISLPNGTPLPAIFVHYDAIGKDEIVKDLIAATPTPVETYQEKTFLQNFAYAFASASVRAMGKLVPDQLNPANLAQYPVGIALANIEYQFPHDTKGLNADLTRISTYILSAMMECIPYWWSPLGGYSYAFCVVTRAGLDIYIFYSADKPINNFFNMLPSFVRQPKMEKFIAKTEHSTIKKLIRYGTEISLDLIIGKQDVLQDQPLEHTINIVKNELLKNAIMTVGYETTAEKIYHIHKTFINGTPISNYENSPDDSCEIHNNCICNTESTMLEQNNPGNLNIEGDASSLMEINYAIQHSIT